MKQVYPSSDQRGRNQEGKCWGFKSYEIVSGGLLTRDSHSGESLGSRGVGVQFEEYKACYWSKDECKDP